MGEAKSIIIKPISSTDANTLCKRLHYSGKVVNNSQLHFGVFYNGSCEGVLQYGPSLDKRKMIGLVTGTGWNGFLELNRMAFSDKLPRLSESRAIGVCHRIIKKNYPHVKWIVSFSDAAQCGDGTIYRASGFKLIGIKKNNQIVEFPDGFRTTRFVLTDTRRPQTMVVAKQYGAKITTKSSMKPFLDVGARYVEGFQLKYIYILDKDYEQKLTVPVIPYSKIGEMGAKMYKGKRQEHESNASEYHLEEGGAVPTLALQQGVKQ